MTPLVIATVCLAVVCACLAGLYFLADMWLAHEEQKRR